jgi:hypothetical protein
MHYTNLGRAASFSLEVLTTRQFLNDRFILPDDAAKQPKGQGSLYPKPDIAAKSVNRL